MTSGTTPRQDQDGKPAELDTDQLDKVAGGLPGKGGPKKGGDPEDGGE